MLVEARDEDGNGLDDGALRDELVTLLLAGHETTATGLAWAFERLVRHPAAMARLRETLAAGDDTYLDAVIKETLRYGRSCSRSPGTSWRRSRWPGTGCPSGTTVMSSVALVQFSSRHWDDRRRSAPSASSASRPTPTRGSPSAAG